MQRQRGRTENGKRGMNGIALLLLMLALTVVKSGCVGVAGGGGNPPAVTISNPAASNISSTGATITWSTNVPADSQVDYGTTPSYGQSNALNPAMVTSHSVVLSGLTPSTLYHYRVKSKDAAGRLATSGDFTFTTGSGGTPPVISGVTATNLSTTGATVSWITDKPADSQVDYGTTTSYGSSTPLDPTLVTSHSQGLSGLTPGTLYHYQVKSKDGAGNQATSPDFTFTTLPDNTPPVISGISASPSSTSAFISWTTDKPADSQVDYGTTAAYGQSSALNPTQVTNHMVNLSGLTATTLYHYRVKSKASNGLLATSGDNTFTTAGSGGSDFQARCSSPGVIKCVGFDSPADIAGTYGDPFGILPGDATPVIDNTVFASGGGSLKFTIPANSSANSSGSYFTNFSNDLSVQFDSGQEFYVQWRQRFSPEMLRAFPGGNGWKQAIIGEGDHFGGFPLASSCTELEAVMQQDTRYLGPGFYHSCGRFINLDWFVPPSEIRMQHQGPPFCVYPNDPQNGCFHYVANEWMTFQMHIQIGSWNTPSSRIQIWAARQSQPSVMIYDSINSNPSGFTLFNGDPTAKYGKVWLLPYNTNKDPLATNPTAFTWYDELIISRNRIAEPQ